MKKQHGSFYTGDKPEGKFIALYSDGSGGSVFMSLDDGKYMDGVDSEIIIDYDWFADAGFSQWVLLPEGYKLWIERD